MELKSDLMLSIIIPMYNAEKYIEECLDSILNSNLPKNLYELVIVNDGSKDKSPEIAQNYAAKYSNVTYLTQEKSRTEYCEKLWNKNLQR